MAKTTKRPDETFIMTLTMGDLTISAESDTALKTLQSLPHPDKITTKGVLTITNGSLKKEMLFTVPRLKRLFYPAAQPILIKQLIQGLK